MIFGAGSRNAAAAAQRGASLALALPTLAHLPLRAAGYASASVADPHVGATRTIDASRSCLAALGAADLRVGAARIIDASRSCLAALGAAGRGARWTRGARVINAVAATALSVGGASVVK
jgi:hypothetical protein